MAAGLAKSGNQKWGFARTAVPTIDVISGFGLLSDVARAGTAQCVAKVAAEQEG